MPTTASMGLSRSRAVAMPAASPSMVSNVQRKSEPRRSIFIIDDFNISVYAGEGVRGVRRESEKFWVV